MCSNRAEGSIAGHRGVGLWIGRAPLLLGILGGVLLFAGIYDLASAGREAGKVHVAADRALKMGGTTDSITPAQRLEHPVAARIVDASDASIIFLDRNALALLRGIGIAKCLSSIAVLALAWWSRRFARCARARPGDVSP